MGISEQAIMTSSTMGQSCSSASIPSSNGPAPARNLRSLSEIRKEARSFLQVASARKSMDSTVSQDLDQFEVYASTQQNAARQMRKWSVVSEDSVVSSVIGRCFEREKYLWGSKLMWEPKQRHSAGVTIQ